jgi:hypothetical protein
MEAALMLSETKEPARYKLIFPSNTELRVMMESPEAMFIARSFEMTY